jgi:pyruvate kinase
MRRRRASADKIRDMRPWPRRTRIIATLGPATDGPGVLEALLRAGADVVRLNASHGTREEHLRRIRRVRRLERRLGRPTPIVFDLAGPKIRIGALPRGPLELRAGARLVLAPEGRARGAEIPVTYGRLARDVRAGNRILVDDGLFDWLVEEVRPPRLTCRVLVGGILREHKGLNFPGVRLSVGALTDKDRDDAGFAASAGVDYLALSFVRSSRDLFALRRLLARDGSGLPVIAKIEKPEALDGLEGILRAADGIMVARGDLGVEVEPQRVPEIQKRLIRLANEREIPVITATQMLESMVEHPRPTRAEASDVANAIFDGTDAVMLSAETAVGKFAVPAVEIMARIAELAEQSEFVPPAPAPRRDRSVAHAVAVAASHAAADVDAAAIVCFTESGRTALLLSKLVRGRPIFAISRRIEICRRAAMFAGVVGVQMAMPKDTDRMLSNAKMRLRERGLLGRGDRIVIVSGSTRVRGATNLLKVDVIGTENGRRRRKEKRRG